MFGTQIVDSEGNVYIAGSTGSLDFPTRNAYQEDFAGGGTPNGDIFVTKVDASGDFIVYSTYIGGAGTDVGHGIERQNFGPQQLLRQRWPAGNGRSML